MSASAASYVRPQKAASTKAAAGREGYIERWQGLLEEVQRVIALEAVFKKADATTSCWRSRAFSAGWGTTAKGREWMSFAARFANKAGPITHVQLARWCAVTLTEVADLGLLRLRPDFLSSYEQRDGRSRRKRKGRPVTERRRAAVARLWNRT